MPRKAFPPDVIKQAREVAAAWREINAPLYFGPVSTTALQENINASRTLQAQVSVLEMQLAALRSQRDESNKGLWEKIKRVRAGVKAAYGDDSLEYKKMSGTETKERKPPGHKRVKK